MTDYRSAEAAQRVATDSRMANQIGFTATPAMVVNGVPQGGFSSYEQMNKFWQRCRSPASRRRDEPSAMSGTER